MRYVGLLGTHILLISACLGQGHVSGAPPMPAFKCELTYTGRVSGKLCSDGGVMSVTNCSNREVDIDGVPIGPYSRFDADVIGPDGKRVATSPNWIFTSLVHPPKPRILEPRQSFAFDTNLLQHVPETAKVAGKYTVTATFEFDGKVYKSNPVEFHWAPGKCEPAKSNFIEPKPQ